MGATKDVMFGKQVSGTPLETRGLTSQLANTFAPQNLGKLQMQGMMNMLGFDPSQLGLGEFAQAAMNFNPQSLAGGGAFGDYLSAREPFDLREQGRARGESTMQAANVGARFGGNTSSAASQAAGEIAGRQEAERTAAAPGFANIDIQSQLARNQGFGSILNALPALAGAAMDPYRMAAGFAAPGAPQFQQGIAGDLLGAGGMLLGSYLNPMGMASGIMNPASMGGGQLANDGRMLGGGMNPFALGQILPLTQMIGR
jgi:hypothetical protein